MADDRKWYWVTALAACGLLDSVYLLLYQTRKIKHLVCPVFNGGCEQVVGSPVAYLRGIPDAIFGVAGYATAAAVAAAIPGTRGRARKSLARAAIGGSLVAAGLSAYLTYSQPTKTGAWCFWCLTSAGLSAVMTPLAISGAREILREK